jgi:hypothetical protein
LGQPPNKPGKKDLPDFVCNGCDGEENLKRLLISQRLQSGIHRLIAGREVKHFKQIHVGMSEGIQPDAFLFWNVFRDQVANLLDERRWTVSRVTISIDKPLGQVFFFRQGQQGRIHAWIQIGLKGAA